MAIDYVARFNAGSSGLQFVTDKLWISSLGIHYKLGLSGLNVALVLLTTILFTVSLAWSSQREIDRPRLYYFHFGLAQSAVLGAFLAQDLVLFVGFFDLMLIPFYFLVGSWGTGDRVRATVKMVIYTAAGSFLMLAAAIAAGVLASNQHGTAINFTFTALAHLGLSRTDQDWIFLGFAAAFLVKMPLTPFHGWLTDAYRSMPIPAVAVFSGVVSKVAAYGFIAIVLPLFPQASHHYQTLMLVIALISVLWATAMAFTTRDARLVIAYSSSVAQMGFILLGIFSLKPAGAPRARCCRCSTTVIVTAASFFVVAAVAARAVAARTSTTWVVSPSARRCSRRFFLIVTLANLAMPGSSNFIGEFMILLGAFNSTRAGRRHRLGRGRRSRRTTPCAVHHRDAQPRRYQGRVLVRGTVPVEAIAIVPLVAIILVLAFYPQFGLDQVTGFSEGRRSPRPR